MRKPERSAEAGRRRRLGLTQAIGQAVTGEDVADEEELVGAGKDAAVKAAAKGKLLSHIVKRNVMQVRICLSVRVRAHVVQQAAAWPAPVGGEQQMTRRWQNVVPTMAALKHVLEQAQSPLLGALMASLAHVLKDYRPEIEDILASNRQLAAELEFDLRQQEIKEEEEAAAAAECKLLQQRVAHDLASEAGAAVGTPHKDSRRQESGSGLGAPAPGSVMKRGVMPPPCFRSPAAATTGAAKTATPLSIPRLAGKGASKAGEEDVKEEHECQRATRATRLQRRSGKEDRENVPLQ